MSTKTMIYVISCGVDCASVTDGAKQIISKAPVIAGGKRLLKMFAGDNHEQVVIGAHAVDTVKELVIRATQQDIAILASGDALFHGIAGTLAKLTGPENYTIIPNITAFQALCAKVKQSWSDCELFSIHGGNGIVPWRRILSSEQAVIYCDNRTPAHALAAELLSKYPASSARSAISGANLGLDDEVIYHGSLQEISTKETAGLSILMLLKPENAQMQPPLSLGLDDDTYEHENNLITHPETRAVILSKLRLRGGIMWDLGAGSGSVGLEAAGMCRQLDVYAVEKSPDRVSHIISNAASEGLSNHNTVSGNILEQLDALPNPDVVFIGGGGKDIKEIIRKAYDRLSENGRIVASAVTLETVATLQSVLDEHLTEVVSIGVSRSKQAGSLTMMKAENQITIFTYTKGGE